MAGPRPLDGLRVLDIGAFIAAPFAATLFGEFGAEVIKIELPKVGDHARRLGTPTEAGDTLVWLSEARNKKSVTLDLRRPEGTDIFKRLVAESDVVCENFQSGTLEKWGLGWDVLGAINPRLVLLRISGYGQTGPYAGRPCFGRIANGFGGLSYLSGEPDRPPAQPGSATLPDYLSGLFGAFAALMALRHRDRAGVGQVIDIGLYEGIFRILDEVAPAFARTGFVRERLGADTPIVAPHSHYPTSDGRWVAIACTNDAIFARLASAMGRPELATAERWGRGAARVVDRIAVNAAVAEWTRTLPRDELLTACAAAEVPCGPIYAIDEIFEDPQYAARQNILYADDPRAGVVAVPNTVPRLDETPGRVEWLGPSLGAHTVEILTRLAGLDEGELNRLRRLGVV
jgi:crotonobetainyl-CoA:carnitine CoA-transferase CaiB-like acyl-CoA transferase